MNRQPNEKERQRALQYLRLAIQKARAAITNADITASHTLTAINLNDPVNLFEALRTLDANFAALKATMIDVTIETNRLMRITDHHEQIPHP